MKRTHGKRLTIGILGVLLLIGILVYYFWMRPSEPSPMFTYEFIPDPPGVGVMKMSIKQVEGLEYSIMPQGEIIVSEPSPDWGIEIYLTEDHSGFLYFYGDYSPGWSDYFPNGMMQERDPVMINEKEMRWGSYGNYIVGSYRVSDDYGIIFELEETLWEDHKKLIIDLMESAQVTYNATAKTLE